MLVLARRQDQKIVLESDSWNYRIEIVAVETSAERVRIGFTAPDEVRIVRAELHPRKHRAARAEQ
jgi:carbon storage regulator CsrA